MKVWEVKKLFALEFGKLGLSRNDLRNTWEAFINDLFDGGVINARVFERLEAVEIA